MAEESILKAAQSELRKHGWDTFVDHLRRLNSVLGEISEKLEYTVGFSDGTSVRYTDVEDIIKLPNSNERPIEYHCRIAATQSSSCAPR